MRYLSMVMVVNNLIGVMQYVILRHDDAFTGLYSTHGIGVHGLGIINGIIFLHFFIRFRSTPRWSLFFIMLFFLGSFVMSFFGLALVMLLMALVIYYALFQFRVMTILKIVPLLIITLGILYITSSRTFEYNYNILNTTFSSLSEQDFSPDGEMPRKLTLFYYYGKVFTDDLNLFLFGCGPGNFNSRASFLLNGDYSDNLLVKVLGTSSPHYAEQYAYPLWNEDILSIEFNDGTRNQPFSSLIAFLAEYGFIFTFVLLLLIVMKVKALAVALKKSAECKESRKLARYYLENRDFLIVSGIFVFLVFCTGNLMENTEILIFVIVVKLIEMSVPNKTTELDEAN